MKIGFLSIIDIYRGVGIKVAEGWDLWSQIVKLFLHFMSAFLTDPESGISVTAVSACKSV